MSEGFLAFFIGVMVYCNIGFKKSTWFDAVIAANVQSLRNEKRVTIQVAISNISLGRRVIVLLSWR